MPQTLTTLYSSAALFKALANNPLVPPPAHNTSTFVCSVMLLCCATSLP